MTAHDWLLDVADSSLAGGVADPVTLAFAGRTAASGTDPCNTHRGAVTLDGDDGVRIADIATTLMSCEPALEVAEREYLDALAQVRTADTRDPDRLVLTSDGVRLSFTAIEQPTGTSVNCEEPAGVMAREAAIAAALTAASTVQITPASLTMRDDVGDIVLTALRA
ncbi:META domain-containing protein [Geodermatophilus sp. SYSU D00079]